MGVLKYFIIITLNCLIAKTIFLPIEFNEEQRFDSVHLFDPYRFTVIENFVFVIDIQGERPFLKFDSTGKFINSFGGWGQGPGEIDQGTTYFVGSMNNTILIYNHNIRKILCFNINGDFLKRLEVPSNSFISAALTSGNKLVLLDYFSDSYANTYTLVEDLTIENKKAVSVGNYKEIPELENCRNNFLLKQGPICTDYKGNIFMGFQFSSLIVGFDDKGTNIFKTLKPENISIPLVIAKNGVFHSPDVGKYPEINVSLSVDQKYVYAVYSGTKLTLLNFAYTADDLFQGEVVHVYDKKTSDYLWSFKLPYPVRDFKVTKESIFLLSVDPEPALVKYKKPGELR